MSREPPEALEAERSGRMNSKYKDPEVGRELVCLRNCFHCHTGKWEVVREKSRVKALRPEQESGSILSPVGKPLEG